MFVCVSSVQLSCLLLFFIFMKVKESFSSIIKRSTQQRKGITSWAEFQTSVRWRSKHKISYFID